MYFCMKQPPCQDQLTYCMICLDDGSKHDHRTMTIHKFVKDLCDKFYSTISEPLELFYYKFLEEFKKYEHLIAYFHSVEQEMPQELIKGSSLYQDC